MAAQAGERQRPVAGRVEPVLGVGEVRRRAELRERGVWTPGSPADAQRRRRGAWLWRAANFDAGRSDASRFWTAPEVSSPRVGSVRNAGRLRVLAASSVLEADVEVERHRDAGGEQHHAEYPLDDMAARGAPDPASSTARPAEAVERAAPRDRPTA